MKLRNIFSAAISAFLLASCASTPAPAPFGALPSEDQVRWQQMEYYGFIHFGLNTFTEAEWGFGETSPEEFNPSQLDAEQWARVAKDAGMRGIILTAKHHDGFCLWPTATTDYSIVNSPWKDGKGDLVKEVSDACRKYGLKFGIYLSPWDRNSAKYGTAEYITMFREQLRELLTNYGEVFEVWFDGANGGDGYYGGARETRKIDRETYYDWENTRKMVRELQPQAMLFSDAGPDIRWCGNESGSGGPTNWSTLNAGEFYPGTPKYDQLGEGHEDGTHWIPSEVDTSIRPHWFYFAHEDDKVKSLELLLDIYYNSVGSNSTLLLNFPVDKRGLIHENDAARVVELATQLEKEFAENLAPQATIEVSNTRGGATDYAGENLFDGKYESYWATDEGVTQASVTLDFGKELEFNRLLLQEYIPLGQRIKEFTIDAFVGGAWKTIDTLTTIGYKRIVRFDRVTASKLRVLFTSKAPIVLNNIEVFNAPDLASKTQNNAIVQDRSLWKITSEGADRTALDGDSKTYLALNGALPQDLVVDMGEVQSIKGFSYLPFAQDKEGVIKTYEFYVSVDGESWKKVASGAFDNIQSNPIEQSVGFDATDARFLKLRALSTTQPSKGVNIAEIATVLN